MTTTTTLETSAKVIAHSVYPGGPEIVTVQATGRRFILSELNTHRSLNKNSASSRAIPVSKQVQRILEGLAYPEVWASEQRGMQGGDEIHPEDAEYATEQWEKASKSAIKRAVKLHNVGVHKSIVNRLLEPFMWHTVVMTGTAWENFFDQRCSPLAQPEIRVMAEAIRTAIQNSTPQHRNEGEWHLPYVGDDKETCEEVAARTPDGEAGLSEYYAQLAQISAARCARVSYLTQEGKRDIAADLDLYEKLVTAQPPHWSPLEHVATPWAENRGEGVVKYPWGTVDFSARPKIGNLLGWRSLRTEVEAMQGVETYR